MLLDSVLDENAIISESVVDATDALTECLVGIEESYGEMMIEQAKAEFKQYVNEGSIEPLNEGVVESIKNFFKKLWNFIKKYWNKLKNWVTGLNKNAYQYFQVNHEKINSNIKSVTRFYGYPGLKNFETIKSLNGRIAKAIADGKKEITMQVNMNVQADKSSATSDERDANDNANRQWLHKVKTTIVGNSSSTEESFLSILKDDIRGASKETTVSYEFNDIAKVLGSEAAVKQLALNIKMQEATTKDLENVAYGFNHAKNETDRSGRAANLCTQLAKLLTSACNAASSMIPAVVSQADRYQHAVVSGKSDDERKNEDADMSVDDAKAYLESIGLA